MNDALKIKMLSGMKLSQMDLGVSRRREYNGLHRNS
jgi:hypothetical protein